MIGPAPHSAGLSLVMTVEYHSGMQRLQYVRQKALKDLSNGMKQ
jgi:hypothetical protein